jgi:hypothetical protein
MCVPLSGRQPKGGLDNENKGLVLANCEICGDIGAVEMRLSRQEERQPLHLACPWSKNAPLSVRSPPGSLCFSQAPDGGPGLLLMQRWLFLGGPERHDPLSGSHANFSALNGLMDYGRQSAPARSPLHHQACAPAEKKPAKLWSLYLPQRSRHYSTMQYSDRAHSTELHSSAEHGTILPLNSHSNCNHERNLQPP